MIEAFVMSTKVRPAAQAVELNEILSPPPEPERAPRWPWILIALFTLGMFAAAIGVFLWSREMASSRDLKRATAVKINYVANGKLKSLNVTDPAEVRDLLDSLEIKDTNGGWWQSGSPGSIDFTLRDGTVAHVLFDSAIQLNRQEWGQVIVTDKFHKKVNALATKAEGRPIDILNKNN
jgi:hypothetical protein